MGNFFEEVLAEELKKQQAAEATKKAEEEDDENFIRKDEPQEVAEKEEKSPDLISKIKNFVFPKNNQQRNLTRETGGFETEKKKESSEKDVWDERSEEVDKMGSTNVFNTSGMRSVVWKKKRERLNALKHNAEIAAAGSALKGKVTTVDANASPTQGCVSRLKNLRQDRSGIANEDGGISR